MKGLRSWAQVLSIRHTKLLADFYPHGKTAQDYGIFLEETGASGRVNILLDEHGVIRWIKRYEISQLPDIQEVFAALESL